MFYRVTVVILAASTPTLAVPSTAAEPTTNALPGHFLLRDSLGDVVPVSTNDVHPSLHPPAAIGLERQVPTPAKGAPQSEPVRQRIAESKSGQESLRWFPATPPVLAPYLANLDEFGNTPSSLEGSSPRGRSAESRRPARTGSPASACETGPTCWSWA